MNFRLLTAVAAAVWLLPAALVAGELEELREQNRQLREKVLQQEQELAALRHWLASVLTADTVPPLPQRQVLEEQHLKSLCDRGGQLVLQTLNVIEFCREALREPPAAARRTHIELKLEELTRTLSSFHSLIHRPGEPVDRSRILAVNRPLGIAVISSGFEDGVFLGMIFHLKRNPAVQLRVTGVRERVAAVELLAGRWEELNTGAEVSALERRTQ